MRTITYKLKAIPVMALFFSLQLSISAQDNCELKKDEDNIKVYSCQTRDSKYKSVRATFEINATTPQYVEVLFDVDKYHEWHYKAVNPRLLEKISETELIYYTQISAPWPVSNRDLILRLKLQQDSTTKVLIVTLESLPDYLPKVKNVVRVPQSHSKMTLTPVGASLLKVNYFIQADPGGSIPAWLANLVSTQGPYETFKNLIDRLEMQKYDASIVSSTKS